MGNLPNTKKAISHIETSPKNYRGAGKPYDDIPSAPTRAKSNLTEVTVVVRVASRKPVWSVLPISI
ncbi:hypothetical protein P154DRAFT_306522 [Amniculicola lignicola CBS 123094]|uniref:Uncharacterized protein n=1 Tax=Amniculicola lignicola CBS 123094 TaxID=1392246 RepID=A0A6A5W7E6_9PLEO|nr:hypothetical protein P154DRAFT_306522 [Amniculicola lignicola CBS 123094]